MLPEIARPAASDPAATRKRPPPATFSSDAILPTCSTIPVNIAQVSFHGKVRTELLDTYMRQFSQVLGSASLQPRSAGRLPLGCESARQLRSVKKAHFVDDIGVQCRFIQYGTGFKHHAGYVAAAKLRHHRV